MEGRRLLHPLTGSGEPGPHGPVALAKATRVGIAFGSNQGDRLENLRAARERVLALAAVTGDGLSAPVYETAPVDCPPGTGAFLNTVVEITVSRHVPLTRLLDDLRGIEGSLGRPSRHPRNAPRPIDLDILYAGATVSDLPELILPHPRIAQRRFVLAPLAAIRPDLVLPGRRETVAELLAEANRQEEVRLYATRW